MNPRSVARPVLLLLSLTPLIPLASCRGNPKDFAYTESDSAGVRVVDTHRFSWSDGDGWRVSAVPTVAYGETEGPEALQFFQITGGIKLPDGRIVVLNSGSMTVRVFSRGGNLLTEFGGPGDGPGEFRRLSGVHRMRGDTLLIWDAGRLGYSLFTTAGELVRTHRLTAPGTEVLSEVHPMPDDRLVVKTYASLMTGAGDPSIGIHRANAPLLLMSRDGTLLDTLGVFPSVETMVMEFGGTTGVGAPPFLKNAYVGVEGSSIIVGTAERMEVSVLNPSGSVEEVFRFPNLALTVDQVDREWYKGRMAETARTPQEEQILPLLLEGLIFPETRAAFNALETSDDGVIWLNTGLHYPVGPPSPEWTVISRDGVFLGQIMMPDRFAPLEFGEDYVLGVWKDEMDVEFVQVYALEK